jgi:YopX protein
MKGITGKPKEYVFRVWDNILNEMIYSDPSLVIRLSGKITDSSTTVDGVLMQYTGLRDKNNVSIFEKDIVRFSDWSPKLVVWSAPRYALEGTLYLLNDYENKEMEVIGNIYENPTLINK